VKFALVGVANTVVYWGGYLLLLHALPYFAAHLTAFVIALVASFFLNSYWTFRVRPTLRKFLYFPLTNVPNFLATSFGVVLLIEWLHFSERLAPLVAAVIAVPFTFVLSRIVLLDRTSRSRQQSPDALR